MTFSAELEMTLTDSKITGVVTVLLKVMVKGILSWIWLLSLRPYHYYS